jgi:pimeloyl-ACP methyl ester carboxylesterase
MSANPALILLPGMHGRSATQEVKDELATIMSDFHPAGFRLMARSLADSDTRDVLRAVRAPTLLVWGEEDVRSPVSVGRAMESLIPGARLVVIPRAAT